jgi:Ca2+-binding RTX toxin-like protein
MADIIGTGGPDSLIGSAHGDSIQGLGGDDVIDGDAGADSLDGGTGNDSIWGGVGADLILGGNGDDMLVSGRRGGYATFEPGNSLEGGGGNDDLWLHPGDTADGGAGTDTFSLNFNRSEVDGGAFDHRGLDRHGAASFLDTSLSYVERGTLTATLGADVITVGAIDLQVLGNDGDDHISITGAAGANGGAGDDLIVGHGRDNGFEGGVGADTLIGGGGHDYLDGGSNDDLLVARSADTLEGGGGADTFQILTLAAAGSYIGDLEQRDTIDLRRIDADVTREGNQRFVLVGHLDGHAGQAAMELVEGLTYLRLDVDGDAAADASLILQNDQTGFTEFQL